MGAIVDDRMQIDGSYKGNDPNTLLKGYSLFAVNKRVWVLILSQKEGNNSKGNSITFVGP